MKPEIDFIAKYLSIYSVASLTENLFVHLDSSLTRYHCQKPTYCHDEPAIDPVPQLHGPEMLKMVQFSVGFFH